MFAELFLARRLLYNARLWQLLLGFWGLDRARSCGDSRDSLGSLNHRVWLCWLVGALQRWLRLRRGQLGRPSASCSGDWWLAISSIGPLGMLL